MIVYIKNKLVSLGGSSIVKDSEGNNVFKVKGKVKIFSPTRKKKIYDMQGNKLYVVRNKFWKFFTTKVYIYKQKQKIATLKRVFTAGKKTFILENYSEDITITGTSILGEGFNILRNGEKIGNVRQEFTIVKDSYILQAVEDDIPFLVAVVIAIDNFKDSATSIN